MNEEQREHFKELCAVWIDHLNQVISFHPADGFEHLPFATHEAQMPAKIEIRLRGRVSVLPRVRKS